MKILYEPNYKIENTKYIVVHHWGSIAPDQPYSSSINKTIDQLEAAHRALWNFKSPYTGKYSGYNFFIDKLGIITQARVVGEETAANKSWNFGGVAISICLSGNFNKDLNGKPIDIPTSAQIDSFKKIVSSLNLPATVKIIPHRALSNTSCYGNSLNDLWAEDLMKIMPLVATEIQIAQLNLLRQIIEKLKELLAKLKGQPLGSLDRESCL